VLLNKLESGFLLFQTQQGLVAVEPSFWQRVYLLWTFRNFRELSPPLLNTRQTALINDLFCQHTAVISHEYEPSLQIGVVENFVPPAIEIGATPAMKTDASTAMKAKLPEQTAGQYAAPPVIPIAAVPAMNADSGPAVKKEKAEMEGTVIDRAETAPENVPDRAFAPKISRLRLASSNLAMSKPAAFRLQVSRIVILRFAAAIGALSLCAGFIVAFHRIGTVPGSQAHSSPPQLNSPDSSSAPGPTPVAENSATVPEVTPQAGAEPDAAVKPAPGREASSITTTQRMMTPERASRGATARVASRSNKVVHAVAFSRISTSTLIRRTTFAPASRGSMARSAQSYFNLADLQMHKGNYAAAAANYKRAWQIEENRAAAEGRLARARRAMQAKKQSIALPR
jgi:hypothetical protein